MSLSDRLIGRRPMLRALAASPLAIAMPGLLLGQHAAQAAEAAGGWPKQSIRVVVPFLAGGATDVSARVTGEWLGRHFGQTFVIDNRPGAGGNVGAEVVAHAEGDGYTVLMGTIGTNSINQHIYRKMAFNSAQDFTSIGMVSEVANGIFVNPKVPINSVQELIAFAKKNPGEINFGTPGNGSSGHMCGELLKLRTGIDMQHVPYKGSAGVLTDVVGGRVDIAIDNLPAYLPQVQEGNLRLIAVTSAERWFAVPKVPTVIESGVPDFTATAWFLLQAPKKTPPAVVKTFADALALAMKDDAVQAKLRDVGAAPRWMDPAATDRFIEAEDKKWAAVAKAAKTQLD